MKNLNEDKIRKLYRNSITKNIYINLKRGIVSLQCTLSLHSLRPPPLRKRLNVMPRKFLKGFRLLLQENFPFARTYLCMKEVPWRPSVISVFLRIGIEENDSVPNSSIGKVKVPLSERVWKPFPKLTWFQKVN